ncbi:MAG: hypothetical protein PVF49_07345 [Anaerolineales bacterium]|jgi:hypothetical protein
MKLKDRMEHAANVVKWKADQQRRILAKQGEIRDVEAQIRTLKSNLSQTAHELYEAGQLKEKALVEICDQIAESQADISTKENELEVIRNEEPPDEPESMDIPEGAELSGLICPECGRALVGKFCPEHGVEGVEPESKEQVVVEAPVDSDVLVCPECGRELSGKFCPEHGLEGVEPG